MLFSDDNINQFKKKFASANINFLIWAGASSPFLPLLGNIEQKINQAIKDENINDQVDWYKEYLINIMFPNRELLSWKLSNLPITNSWWVIQKNKLWIDRTQKVDFEYTINIYENFLSTLYDLLWQRKTTILDKQINIFTTNIDILLETALDELGIYYHDWFVWRLNPVFSLNNFRQSIVQRSTHYNNKSEIPVFNIIKMHWSTNWKYQDNDTSTEEKKVYLSNDLSHIKDDLKTKIWEDFIRDYKKSILVVNPEDQKFADTVLNKYYYELLRFYSNELEKENSMLFVIGFSMADQHIREITKRVARSNPTLQIYVILYSKTKELELKESLETDINRNIFIITPTDWERYDLDTITRDFFSKINPINED